MIGLESARLSGQCIGLQTRNPAIQGSSPALATCRIFLSHPEFKSAALLVDSQQGPVVRRPISTNLRLNSNLGFFLFYWKTFSRIIFSILSRSSNQHTVDKKELNS